jgi:hypothetical protein
VGKRSHTNKHETAHIRMLFLNLYRRQNVRHGNVEIGNGPAWQKLFPERLQTVRVTLREVCKTNLRIVISKNKLGHLFSWHVSTLIFSISNVSTASSLVAQNPLNRHQPCCDVRLPGWYK